MIAEITAGYQSLKAATDIAKGLDAVKTAVAVNEVKLDLQRHLLNAHTALTAANQADADATHRIRELENKLMDFEIGNVRPNATN